MEGIKVQREYDFSKATPNPYLKRLQKQASTRTDVDSARPFKRQAGETGIASQNVTAQYLSGCPANEKKLTL
jgi:hypothetical protein